MRDLSIELPDHPGALGTLGTALGRAGVSIEGGGVFVHQGVGVAHFLFHDGASARAAVESAGFRVLAEREVLIHRLRQDVPGQLGAFTSLLGAAGVNIEVMYSDHDHQTILVVDDLPRALELTTTPVL
jgi:hypothetical protein